MFFFIADQIMRGKSVMRALLNYEAKHRLIRGRVLDVGGGENPSYYRFFKKAPGAEIINLDMRSSPIDFETDPLPHADASMDCVILCNVLEHVYNHAFLVREVRRALKPGGMLIGFVPFFMQVHPDPHDYFRYTKEALEKLFQDAYLRDARVKEIGYGLFAVHANNLSSFLPRIVNVVLLPLWYILDAILIRLRPRWRQRFPLGYFFEARR